MNNIIERVWSQRGLLRVEDLRGSAFTTEAGGHTFQIQSDEAMSGTVSGSFIRPDHATVAITGSLSGDVASVTLPETCYAVPGRFALVIFLTSSGVKTAIYACVGNIGRSTSDSVVDPGTIIPSIADLIAQIQAAVASIPADYSNLWKSLANTFSTSSAYRNGQFVNYDGNVYRCKEDIPAGTWDASKWSVVALGYVLSDSLVHLARSMTQIASATDLNDITTAGNYRATSEAIVTSLLHKPDFVTNQFALYVISGGATAYPVQIILESGTARIYARSFRADVWSEWNKYSLQDIYPSIESFDAVFNSLSISENVLDYSTITAGKRIRVATGVVEDATNQSVSDYIPIRTWNNFTLTVPLDSVTYGIAYYDIRKEYISAVPQGSTLKFENIPKDAAYFRCTIPNTSIVPGEETFKVYIGAKFVDDIIDSLKGLEIAERTKWLAIGDSITFGVYSYINDGGTSSSGVTDQCWVRLLASSLNYDLTVMASRGMGYTVTGQDPLDSSAPRITLDTLLTRIEALTDDFNLITMAFGINDYATSSSTLAGILTNLTSAISRMITKFPHARLVVVTPFNSCREGDASSNWAYNTPHGDKTLKQVAETIKAHCEAVGVECLFASNGFLFNNYNIQELQPDNTHPSLIGHKLIAKNMAHVLMY